MKQQSKCCGADKHWVKRRRLVRYQNIETGQIYPIDEYRNIVGVYEEYEELRPCDTERSDDE